MHSPYPSLLANLNYPVSTFPLAITVKILTRAGESVQLPCELPIAAGRTTLIMWYT